MTVIKIYINIVVIKSKISTFSLLFNMMQLFWNTAWKLLFIYCLSSLLCTIPTLKCSAWIRSKFPWFPVFWSSGAAHAAARVHSQLALSARGAVIGGCVEPWALPSFYYYYYFFYHRRNEVDIICLGADHRAPLICPLTHPCSYRARACACTCLTP